MKIKQKILSVYKNDTDYSKLLYKAEDFASFSLAGGDYLYVGYRKQISQLFFEFKTANTVDLNLLVEKWNGSAWEQVDIWDETSGFSESGFLFMEELSSESKTTQNSIEQYWIRISLSENSSAMEVRLVNLVFSNAEDLKNEFPYIEEFYPSSFSSPIHSLLSAREYILRKINNAGKYKYNKSEEEISQINQFDIFDINELREASTFYALYKIFMNLSDSDGDNYGVKAESYFNKYQASFKVFAGAMLTLDTDDNGKESEEEQKQSILTTKLLR